MQMNWGINGITCIRILRMLILILYLNITILFQDEQDYFYCIFIIFGQNTEIPIKVGFFPSGL